MRGLKRWLGSTAALRAGELLASSSNPHKMQPAELGVIREIQAYDVARAKDQNHLERVVEWAQVNGLPITPEFLAMFNRPYPDRNTIQITQTGVAGWVKGAVAATALLGLGAAGVLGIMDLGNQVTEPAAKSIEKVLEKPVEKVIDRTQDVDITVDARYEPNGT